MISFILVSGNAGKIAEWQRLLSSEVALKTEPLDLEEIQSFDSTAIVRHKLQAAYALIGSPVVVEDVTAGLDALNGLPGPFIKFFEQRLGEDALYQLAGSVQASAVISCTIGYYDGKREIITSGTVHGTVVSARGSSGFGFDKVFMPAGHSKTFAEMAASEKDAISHRQLALQQLLKQLKQL